MRWPQDTCLLVPTPEWTAHQSLGTARGNGNILSLPHTNTCSSYIGGDGQHHDPVLCQHTGRDKIHVSSLPLEIPLKGVLPPSHLPSGNPHLFVRRPTIQKMGSSDHRRVRFSREQEVQNVCISSRREPLLLRRGIPVSMARSYALPVFPPIPLIQQSLIKLRHKRSVAIIISPFDCVYRDSLLCRKWTSLC